MGEVVVDPERYPNYDLTLMAAFKRETELFVATTLREDRSVLELLDADYTFVNEKLARHYGIPGIYGSRFRRVTVPDKSQRGGLLAQGALLSTTSYPDRTSPVLRGKFLLNNIFGLQTPPPPPGVDTNLAPEKTGEAHQTIRERLAEHRTNPTCSSCHSVIDPLGFALENFDVIGGWRTADEAGKPVDAKGTTMGGANIEGLHGLRAIPDGAPRTVPAHRDGEIARVRARPQGRALRSPVDPPHRPRGGGPGFSMVGVDHGNREKSGFSNEATACSSHLELFPDGRSCVAWVPRSRCRSSMP